MINDDEFDYIYYTYGLKHYGNMPLIEPLEFKDEKRVRDFVIVLDTSASCMGATVRAFLRKTYDILKGSESLSSKVNVHIIQCDSDITRLSLTFMPSESSDGVLSSSSSKSSIYFR